MTVATDEIRPQHKFAPSVRSQSAVVCCHEGVLSAMAMLRQSSSGRLNSRRLHITSKRAAAKAYSFHSLLKEVRRFKYC